MPSDLELLGRLLLAAVLGGTIGAERELNDQAAGLRTHVLLTIGACLFTLVSAYGFGGSTDPSRLAAQIVTGIGFLGGGAIVRHGLNVKGLTTAASIWATAAVGVAIGAGSYLLAVGTTVLVVLTLYGLGKFGNLIQRWGSRARSTCSRPAPTLTSSGSWRSCGARPWPYAGWSGRRPATAAGSSWWSS
jgi:putative Mg2+ transporter-C (MgtC) family protein